ncbi:hypothetical protein CHJ26_06040 [Listeria monocytogenes]|nr:hypothetical protein [Listeria monocytogenes]EAF1541169.1 hypothetical protein [Listeria monocytogenes]
MSRKYFNIGFGIIIGILIIDFLNLPSLFLKELQELILILSSVIYLSDTNSLLNIVHNVSSLIQNEFYWLNMTNINWSLINILVVIFLYLLTFKNIEARTISKEINKEEIVYALLKECYEKMNDNLNDYYDLKDIIVRENIDVLIDVTFMYDNLIQEYIKEGVLTKEELTNYHKIKSRFKKTVGFLLFFNRKPKLTCKEQKTVQSKYEDSKKELEKLITSSLQRLEAKRSN